MQIDKLSMVNFLSHAESEICLANRGLVLVEGENRDSGGSNGAGKSSIFEGLRWCLYGSTSRGSRSSEVVRRGHSNTAVTCNLQVGGTQAEVRRYRDHKQFGNSLQLWLEGTNHSQATDKETQLKIIELLQLDQVTFTNAVLFPQGSSGFASLTDAGQKEVFERLLGLQRFSQAQERAKALATGLANKAYTLKQDLKNIAARIADKQATLKNLEEQAAQFKVQQATLIDKLERQIAALEANRVVENVSLRSRLTSLQQEYEHAAGSGISDIAKEAQQAIVNWQREQGRLQGEISSYGRELHNIKLFDPEVEAAKTKSCPACGQDLPGKAYSHLLEGLKQELANRQATRESVLKESGRASREAIELDEKIAKSKDLLTQTQQFFDDLNAQQHEIRDTQSAIDKEAENRRSWDTSYHFTRQQLETEKNKTAPYDALINKEIEAALALEKLRQDAEAQITPLEVEQQYFQFWVDGFGNKGVKSLLLDTVTPFLNKRASEYIKELTNNTAFINFTTQVRLGSGELRDKFAVEVEQVYGSANYGGTSGGESRRADIATLFALGDLAASRASAPVKLRLLDEPFESLDDLGCEQVVGLLKSHIVPNASTVLVMSHQASLKEMFESRITVIKENGVSRIVEHRSLAS